MRLYRKEDVTPTTPKRYGVEISTGYKGSPQTDEQKNNPFHVCWESPDGVVVWQQKSKSFDTLEELIAFIKDTSFKRVEKKDVFQFEHDNCIVKLTCYEFFNGRKYLLTDDVTLAQKESLND